MEKHSDTLPFFKYGGIFIPPPSFMAPVISLLCDQPSGSVGGHATHAIVRGPVPTRPPTRLIVVHNFLAGPVRVVISFC